MLRNKTHRAENATPATVEQTSEWDGLHNAEVGAEGFEGSSPPSLSGYMAFRCVAESGQ